MNRWMAGAAAAVWLMAAAPSALSQAGSAPYARLRTGPEPNDPVVAKLTGQAMSAEKAARAKPKDSRLRKRAGEAWYKAGHALEYSSAGLSPRTRYRGALTDYRRCLALDPSHAEAAREKKQIEDIYRTMPGGIPK